NLRSLRPFSGCWTAGCPPTVWHEAYSPPWPAKHRFPMWKFRNLADQLVSDGLFKSHAEFLTPKVPPDEWFLLAHDEEYYAGFVNATLDDVRWRRIGFTQTQDHEALVRRTKLEVGGTILAARYALRYGLACNTAGGTHHAHRAWGSGYCALNDLAVTAKLLLEERAASRILICDLDVHQGDGTAEILAGEPRAFTLSVHCAQNFPFGFKGMAHLGRDRSDLDAGLSRGTGDDEYLAALEAYIPAALEQHRPDLVLYDAGVDVHVDDDLGYFNLSWEGLRRREDFVLEACLSRNIPIACVIGGGYDRDEHHLARRHAVVLHAAAAAWRRHGLGVARPPT
ncbi:unnamed protein product, partial [Polarella glacialis]